MSNHWMHFFHSARHAEQHGSNKTAGIAYIIIGFFFAPLLFGIPIMIYGIYKLFSK
jgi:hypothetical protein